MSLLLRQCRVCIVPKSFKSIPRSVHTNAQRRFPRVRQISLLSGTALLGGALLVQHVSDTARPNATDKPLASLTQEDQPTSRRPTPLIALIRSYAVYTMCSIPALVDWSPAILGTLMSVPVLRSATEAVMRATFFAQVLPLLF